MNFLNKFSTGRFIVIMRTFWNCWKALFDVLEEEEKVIIKDWGIFEKKEVKPRKILNLATREMMITEEKKIIKFKPRMKMIDKVNELNTLMEEEYEH